MLQRWSVFLGSMSLFMATPALAVSYIDKSQAAAAPRSDGGTGLCGTATHFKAGPPLNKADAEVIMNKPAADPAVLGRTARLFDNINLRNGQPNTTGDFTFPSYRDEVFPYSQDVMAVPPGTDSNFTLRLRGYFNVPATLAGKTISFGLNCDDFCAVRVGQTDLMQVGNELVSSRVIAQLNFKDPGLYPIELVHYQNGSTAYLEWSRSETAVPECPNNVCAISLSDSGKYAGAFKPVANTELYSAKEGSNPGCQECGVPGTSCSTGSYCGDGLCQTCNLNDHCGPSCAACPVTANVCSVGKCVQCTADDQCASGQTCDIPNGKCLSPQPCTSSAQCPARQLCDPQTNLCLREPEPCVSDAMCPPGQGCFPGNSGYSVCRIKPTVCSVATDCKDGFACDVAVHLCMPVSVPVSGCTAVRVRHGNSAATQSVLTCLGIFFAAAISLLFKRSRRVAARSGK